MQPSSLEKCREKALKILESREHSVAELKRKLFATQKFSSQDIHAVLGDLQNIHLLDDRTFAENYLQFLKTTQIGKLKASMKLRAKGLSQQLIKELLDHSWNQEEDNNEDNDRFRAQTAARSKWRSLAHDTSPLPLKLQKLARSLLAKGFPVDIVRETIASFRRLSDSDLNP